VPRLVVELVGTSVIRHEPDPSAGPFVFGRGTDCDLVVHPNDRSISRQAGSLEWTGRNWIVSNRSRTRPIYRVERSGLRAPIGVGEFHALRPGTTRVAITGEALTIELTIVVEGEPADAMEPDDATPARGAVPAPHEATRLPDITRNERLALLAMLEGYLLDHPRYDPQPRTYADAAARLGLPAATVRKRIERLRVKLVECGVVELERADARFTLAEFALSTRLVSRADLAELDGG
jgi:hypothetical protein